jgi:hypothetical protein
VNECKPLDDGGGAAAVALVPADVTTAPAVPAGTGVAVTFNPPAPGDVILSVRIAGEHLVAGLSRYQPPRHPVLFQLLFS